MMHHKSSHLTGAVAAAALLIVAAGGAAIASNMGFKLNKPLVLAGAGGIGNNWTSIPYNNPYGTNGQFCIQTNLPRVLGNTATLTTLDPVSGSFTSQTCLAAGAVGNALTSGRGVQVRVPNVVGNPTSIIIVGSHNPALSFQLLDASALTGQKGNLWFAVPYHTTAVTMADICTHVGMKTSLPKGSGTRLNPATGAFTTFFCGNAGAFNLVLGEHVQLRNPGPTAPFIPAHF